MAWRNVNHTLISADEFYLLSFLVTVCKKDRFQSWFKAKSRVWKQFAKARLNLAFAKAQRQYRGYTTYTKISTYVGTRHVLERLRGPDWPKPSTG